MYTAHHLPRPLLALIFAWPLLALAAPSTPNDPFRDIVIHARKPPEEPICCLRPLTPLEPVDEDLLLSFEEWKSRQLADGQQAPTAVPDFTAQPNLSGTILDGSGQATTILSPVEGSTPSPPSTDAPDGGFGIHDTPEPLSPHFRIPLTDRFNYASLDCSARVHTAHRGAKSAHNILSSKKDRYMLSPCGDRPQFIVVELCDDIWIDTVQMANYEFFSGVFKDFTVSVAKQYEVESSGWTVAGTYTAKNVRGVQSFHPPKSLRDFYRFIRIDFHSHYGSEYYCPISLLRVYGLTHLEQWKWELWENESRAKARALEAQEQAAASSTSVPSVEAADPPQPVPTPLVVEQESTPTVPPPVRTPMITLEAPTPEEEMNDTSRIFRHSTDIAHGVGDSHSPAPTPESTPFEPIQTVNASDTSARAEPTIGTTPPSEPSSTSSSASETKTISLAPAVVPVQFASTGESIYRTIMNRLSALEANTTLYSRYVSSQTGAMHDALRRLHEELGRLESLGRAQSQAHERALADLERERRRLEAEQRALAIQAEALAHDVALEKHLGVAQLCLLLAVLVFLSLTRGAGESPSAVRAWGKRNLSLRSDWYQRFRSRSLTPAPVSADGAESHSSSVPFPSSSSQQRPRVVVSPAPQRPKLPRIELDDTHISHHRPRIASGTRTPIRRYTHTHRHGTPATPTSSRPMLARSTSHSSAGGSLVHPPTIGPMPRSVKKWARSAHLHEVRPRVAGGDASARLNGFESEKAVLRGAIKRKEGRRAELRAADENAEVWEDTDSDGDTVASFNVDSGG
ncbi:unnamed protein product [Peniophora sp. CBMAI 1063]|nr:unnamed protein product [Peniophora sp. CBMAI 1063]